MTTISVIIATRNRPALFREALSSVLRQTTPALEVIIVNDGSDDVHQRDYDDTLCAAGDRARYFRLVSRPRGHGPGYALNFGVSHAQGDYIGFLDDDDSWTDAEHLARASLIIDSAETLVDLYMTNQAAFAAGRRRTAPIWIEDLADILRKRHRHVERNGSYSVSIDDLLCCTGFCHLNTLIVRRALFEAIGGFDESNRWELDRDLFLRLIDQAAVMKYVPVEIARHNIPDPAQAGSVTTALSDLERRLYQLRLLDRAILFAQDRTIRAYARRHKGYTLKRIAQAVAGANRRDAAVFYAREAFAVGPTLKWAAYTIWQMVRSLFP